MPSATPPEIEPENIPRNIPARETAQAWFRRTGHCHGCGNPGAYCTCTRNQPCGCSELHEMGSARLPDALDQFTPPVSVDQEAMW